MNDHELTLSPTRIETPADGFQSSDAWLYPPRFGHRKPRHRAETPDPTRTPGYTAQIDPSSL